MENYFVTSNQIRRHTGERDWQSIEIHRILITYGQTGKKIEYILSRDQTRRKGTEKRIADYGTVLIGNPDERIQTVLEIERNGKEIFFPVLLARV